VRLYVAVAQSLSQRSGVITAVGPKLTRMDASILERIEER
jgi:hypothetical protein